MPAQWTGEIVGELHVLGLTAKQLAKEAQLNDKYLSLVLNGHKTPKNGEKKIRAALERLKAKEEARCRGEICERGEEGDVHTQDC